MGKVLGERCRTPYTIAPNLHRQWAREKKVHLSLKSEKTAADYVKGAS